MPENNKFKTENIKIASKYSSKKPKLGMYGPCMFTEFGCIFLITASNTDSYHSMVALNLELKYRILCG